MISIFVFQLFAGTIDAAGSSRHQKFSEASQTLEVIIYQPTSDCLDTLVPQTFSPLCSSLVPSPSDKLEIGLVALALFPVCFEPVAYVINTRSL